MKALKGLILISTIILFGACSTVSATRYYVSLGDSLAAGVQADSTGANIITDEGYADQLYLLLLATNPNLVLMKFGCPGETTASMAEGGICDYPAGSQLKEAVNFILANQDNIDLITLDIGVNDIIFSDCVDLTDITMPVVDPDCIIDTVFPAIAVNMSLILSDIFAAMGGKPIMFLGMNYYNPFLAAWLTGPAGQMFAFLSDALVMGLDFTVLAVNAYDRFGVPVADVYTAFMSGDFAMMVPFPLPPPNDMVPINVATICTLTFMCPSPLSGAVPNIHANTDGYGLIAVTFFDLITSLGGL